VNHIGSSHGGEAQDLAAVSEVLHGNTVAFRLIVDRYKEMLYRLSFSFLGNREDAEECTQDILMRAFRYLHRFSLEKRFLPWLYGIALNHIRTSYAKNRRREARHQAWQRLEEVRQSADPQELLDTAQSREEIRVAVASLPRSLREPVILHYYEELRVATIAEILGVSEANVKSKLLRGRRRLKKIIEQGATPTG
jgi:RNA polymerase sigma-70 factor (ECF subfamily)